MLQNKNFLEIGVYWEQDEWGGVDSYLKNLINTEIFSSSKFTIFTNKYNKGADRILEFLKNKKIEIVYFSSFNLIKSKFKILNFFINIIKPIFFILSIFQSYIILRKFKFNIFLAQCGGFGNFRSEVAAIFVAKFLNFPRRYLVIHHSCSRPIFWTTLLNITNNLLSKSLTAVICVSKATKYSVFYKSNLFDSNANLKNIVIYNGVKVNKVEDNNSLQSIFKRKDDNHLNIGIVSRIESYKGHLDLIKAFEILPLEYKKKISIFFIGSGSETEVSFLKNYLEKKNIKNYFNFTGYLDYSSHSIISYLDLLVSATRTFEGFGLSIAEAMSVEIPVLATNVGAIPEYLDSNCAKIFEAGDFVELKNSLIDFVDNKQNWILKAAKGKKKIIENFTSDIMAKKYFEYFLSE